MGAEPKTGGGGGGRATAAADRPRRDGRRFPGWTMVGALAWTEVTSWGVLYYAFAVFVAPMGDELGWSRAAVTGAFSVGLLCSGLAAPMVGRWLDRSGPRPVMTTGSVAAALLVLAWATVDDLVGFYLIWVGLGLASAMVLYEPAFAMVARWFVRSRGRALTILTTAGGLASVVYLPLTAWLVARFGWRGALVTLAALLALLTIPPHALLLRRRPGDLGLLPDGDAVGAAPAPPAAAADATARGAIRSPAFRWLAVVFGLAFLANVAITVHLVPVLTDRGLAPRSAAIAAGAIGLAALPGRIVLTPLGDRLPRRYVLAAILAVQAVAVVLLVAVPTTAGLVGFVLLFGAGFGAITPARAALVAEQFGAGAYGTIGGVLALVITLARAAGPVAAGGLHDLWGGYGPVLWLLAAGLAAAAVATPRIDGGVRPIRRR